MVVRDILKSREKAEILVRKFFMRNSFRYSKYNKHKCRIAMIIKEALVRFENARETTKLRRVK